MIELIALLVAVILVAACGMFVAAEFALVTVDRSAVDQAVARGDRGAAGIQAGLRSLSTQLSGAQVGITVTNLAIGFLAEPSIAQLIDGPLESAGVSDGAVPGISLAVALTVATAVTMVFGELVPKNLAIARPLGTARSTQAFQRGFTTVMMPAIRALNASANGILRRLGVEPQEELRSARSHSELAALVRRSAEAGVLEGDTAGLLQRAIAFSRRNAGDIRTPRTRMRSVAGDAPAAAVIALAGSTGLSRFPVTGTGRDEVTGIVHVKQAVAVPVGDRDRVRIASIAAPALLVPAALDLDELSARLREHAMQMAVVVDEYGGVDGVVTLEDLVEELVGEIADEHDPAQLPIRRLAGGGWELSGLLRPDEIREATGVALPENDHVYETVAGLVMHLLGRVPAAGDTAQVPLPPADPLDDTEGTTSIATLTVSGMEGRRVDALRMTVEPLQRGVTGE